MKVVINGEQQDIPADLTVAGLLEHLDLAGRRVAVEINKQLVSRGSHAVHGIKVEDQIEIVTLVGGG